MDRLFSDDNIVSGDKYKHFIKSLRHNVSDLIEVVIDGKLFLAEIIEVTNKYFRFEIIKKLNPPKENLKIYLFQAVTQKKKMEEVFRLNGLLGVYEFIPTITKRLYEKYQDDYNSERNIGILEDSSGVSKSIFLPEIHKTIDFIDAINYSKTLDYSIILYEDEDTNGLINFLEKNKIDFPKEIKLGIFVGPEGGFEKEEIRFAKDEGVIPIRLFNRILRTENAAFSAISAILAFYERMRYES